MALTIPQFEDYLRSLGITGQDTDGEMRYYGSGDEPQRYSQGMINEMQGDPLQAYQKQQLNSQGYIEMPRDADAIWFNQRYGTNFKNGEDYAKWMYGGGSVEQGPDGQRYFKTPNGVDNYVNRPLDYDAPDSSMTNLVKMGLIGFAGAGLGGLLPGAEGIFGAGASGAGAAAAEGAGLAGAAEAAALGELGAGANLGALSADIGGSIAGGFAPSAAGAAGVGVGPTLGSAALLGGAGPTLGAAEAAFGGLGSTLGGSGGLSSLIADYIPSTLTNGGMGLPTTPNLGQISSNIGAPITDAFVSSSGLGTAAGTAGTVANAAGTVANAAGTAGTAANAANTAGAATTGGSAISRLIDGTATASDWASILGNLGATGLGIAGANAQGDAFKDVYNQQMSLGAPYRDKLAQSYQPGFSMADQPDFMNALNLGADAVARATSTKANTFDPGAQMEMQKYVSGNLALPQLNTYRSQLGSFGQLGTNTAGTAALGGAQSNAGTYNALGYGLGQLTQPESPFKGLLSQFGKNNNLFSF